MKKIIILYEVKTLATSCNYTNCKISPPQQNCTIFALLLFLIYIFFFAQTESLVLMGQLYRCETSTSQNSCYSIFQYAQQIPNLLGILLCHLHSVDSSNVSVWEINSNDLLVSDKEGQKDLTQNLANANHGSYKHMVGLKTVLLSMYAVDRLPALTVEWQF